MKFSIFNLFQCLKQKKLYFILLCLITCAALIIGVYAGFNFTNQVFSVDLSNISYIQFLQNECGLFSLIFRLSFSLIIFYSLILICSSKKFLLPIAIIFYTYLVYTQVVVLISLIVIYGFLNSMVLFFVLSIFVVIIIFLFMISMMHMACFTNDYCYFKNCLSPRNYILWLLLAVVLMCIVFAVLLLILKSFVILLVF